MVKNFVSKIKKFFKNKNIKKGKTFLNLKFLKGNFLISEI